MLLRPLSKELDRPLPTKDSGILRTIRDACDYMTGMDKDEPCLALAAEGQRLIKLRAVVALPGLDFGEFCDGCRRAEVASDGRLLCLQPKPGSALAVS